MSPLLETGNLTKRFGPVLANDRISLSVEEGEIRGIIGPNGSGKSTLFNTISGFYESDSGSVRFGGTDITNWAPHRIAKSGLVRTFQIASPFPDLTVWENMLATYSPGLRVGREKKARAREILSFLEIDHVSGNEASDISGGQQKLLGLGRALMLDPDCIMLDEPTAGVNPALQERIINRLTEMNEDGMTFVIVEHDMKLMRNFADQVTVIDQGEVIGTGAFDEMTGRDDVKRAYLGEAQEEEVAL